MEDGFPDDERGDQGLAGLGSPHFPHQNGERVERYSRKVFVGGLPPDIDEGKAVALRSKKDFFLLWAISVIFSWDWKIEEGNLRERITIKRHQKITPATRACSLMIRMRSVCFTSDEITASFRRFGHLFVDWPHKAESKSYFPPKGMLKSHHGSFILCLIVF